MGAIDRESANSQSSSSYAWGMMDASGDSQTSSSTYPFYVELGSSDGLMLGQHVYIEMDEGQEDKKEGLWLSEYYIVDAQTNSPYVWAADKDNRLEKRSVILGQYDEELGEYEIADGLTKKDLIAYPSGLLREGMKTTTNSEAAIDMNPVEDGMDAADEPLPDEMLPDGEMPEEDMDAVDGGMIEDDLESSISETDMGMEEDTIPYEEADMDVPGEDFSAGDIEMMNENPEAALPEDEVLVPAQSDMEGAE